MFFIEGSDPLPRVEHRIDLLESVGDELRFNFYTPHFTTGIQAVAMKQVADTA